MCSDTSAASIMRGIQSTLAEFHLECATWEQELDALLGELQASAGGPMLPWQQFDREQHDQFVAQQMRMAVDLAELRRLFEQQQALFRGLADHAPPPEPAEGRPPRSEEDSGDRVIEQVLARLQQLSGSA